MSSLEQRLAYMEGRMEDSADPFTDIRAELRDLRGESRAEFKALRAEMDRRFTWTISLLIGVLMAIAGLAFQVSWLQPL